MCFNKKQIHKYDTCFSKKQNNEKKLLNNENA